MALSIGDLVAHRYEIIEQIGQGGFGTVYRVSDTRLHGVERALKIAPVQGEAQAQRQLRREAEVLSQLQHPGLPEVFDVVTLPDSIGLVMELLPRRTLAHIPTPCNSAEVIRWLEHIGAVLSYLHHHPLRIAHADIKPSNIAIMPDGTIKLLDFGIAQARLPDKTIALHTQQGYTLAYAAYEQIQGTASVAGDVYSLGGVGYYLLTGQDPPDALTRAAATIAGRPDPLRIHAPAPLANTLIEAMQLNPRERTSTVDQFLHDLRRSATEVTGWQPDTPRFLSRAWARNLLLPIVMCMIGMIAVQSMSLLLPPAPENGVATTYAALLQFMLNDVAPLFTAVLIILFTILVLLQSFLPND